MMAKMDPSTPREPPESSSGPLSSDRNRLSTRMPETFGPKTPPFPWFSRITAFFSRASTVGW